MPGEPTTYLQACSMKPRDAAKVAYMLVSHVEFSAIQISVNLDRETYSPSQAEQIPEGEALVTFRIPSEGINMPNFYGELLRALNSESPVIRQKEKAA